MLHIIIILSFLSLSLQQQDPSTYILPKENQYLKDVINNVYEKISKTKTIGFGLWFKWQPEVLQFISNAQNEQNAESKQSIFVLYLTNNKLEHQLKIWSDFFIFQEEIRFYDQFEGVWIFFDSIFDFNKMISTFYLYKSLPQELTQYKIDGIPIFQDQILYQIGKICDQCAIQNFENCLTRFEGRLSILFQRDNFDESVYLTTIENMYSFVNDCVEKNQKLINGSFNS